MFDIAFSELIIVAIVALIVIGPEKLPKVARTMGSLVGRMQRYVSAVKVDIERELALEDIKKLQQNIQRDAADLQQEIGRSIHAGVDEVKQVIENSQQPSEDDPTAMDDQRSQERP